MGQKLPTVASIETTLRTASASVASLRGLRLRLRRKATPGVERSERITAALEEVLPVAADLRRLMGFVGAGSIAGRQARAIRDASYMLQYERHALRRMRR